MATTTNTLIDLPHQIERMHRRFLDVARIELNRIGAQDISPVQAMMLANIGDGEISVRDLIERGYYLGSNASYNLKNLVEGGYIHREAAARDRRSARLSLTDKGKTILQALQALNAGYGKALAGDGVTQADLEATHKTLRKLERRWSDAVRFPPDEVDGF